MSKVMRERHLDSEAFEWGCLLPLQAFLYTPGLLDPDLECFSSIPLHQGVGMVTWFIGHQCEHNGDVSIIVNARRYRHSECGVKTEMVFTPYAHPLLYGVRCR